jgi:hypothetical protein
MSAEASSFYSRIINEALLNIYAVKLRRFDKHLCNMYSKEEWAEWRSILPEMVRRMEAKIDERKEAK